MIANQSPAPAVFNVEHLYRLAASRFCGFADQQRRSLNRKPRPFVRVTPVLVYLRGRIKALGRMGEKVTANKRIAYDVERDFCEVKVQKERILVRVFDMGVSDPTGIASDIPRSHDWTYEKQIPVDSNELV
jgi:predicted transport protein